MRIVIATFLSVFLFFTGVAQAETNIAVFNVQDVITKSDAFVAAKKVLETTFSPKQKEIEKKLAELEKMGEKLSASSPKAEQDKFFKAQKEYNDLATAYMQNVQQAEIQSRETMDKLIGTAAKQFAEEKKFDLLLDAAAVRYTVPALDVTAEILVAVNKIWNEDQKEK